MIHSVELDEQIALGRSGGSARMKATAPATSSSPSASARASSSARAAWKSSGSGRPIQRSIAPMKSRPASPMKLFIDSSTLVGWPRAVR